MEQNFRDKFEALNRCKLTDAEFARLLDEIVTPDVFTAAKTLREINSFTLDDGTPLGKLSHKKRPMLDAGGGIRYLLNVFLVVPEDRPTFGLPNSWEGRRATLRVAMFVDDGAGGSVLRQESVVPVTLHEKAL